MERVVIALLASGVSINATAQVGCDQPPLVIIPAPGQIEGNESQVSADVEAYFRGMQEYVSCVRFEIDSAGDEVSELYLQILVQRNNQAVAEAEAVQRWLTSRLPDAVIDESP